MMMLEREEEVNGIEIRVGHQTNRFCEAMHGVQVVIKIGR